MARSLSHVLLSALFTDLPYRHHILTLSTGTQRSTAVQCGADGFEVEHPETVERLCAALKRGNLASVVLRTFTDQLSHTYADGAKIRLKLVRGWVVSDRTLYPLDEAAMFDAHCTDAASGEPLSPEEGVVYTGAPEIDLALFHEN